MFLRHLHLSDHATSAHLEPLTAERQRSVREGNPARDLSLQLRRRVA